MENAKIEIEGYFREAGARLADHVKSMKNRHYSFRRTAWMNSPIGFMVLIA